MNKSEIYKTLLQEASGLIDPKLDDIGNMANITALIHQHFQHHWIGFYRVVGQELMLGPFQGPVACTRIGFGKGVCGQAWEQGQSIIVQDVHQHPGHIACSPYSNSEIVVPCIRQGKVWAVLDIDSTEFNAFEQIDQDALEELLKEL